MPSSTSPPRAHAIAALSALLSVLLIAGLSGVAVALLAGQEPAISEAAPEVASEAADDADGGWGGSDDGSVEEADDASISATSVVDAVPPPPPVTLAFGGDVMFEGMLAPQLEADPEGLLAPLRPVLAAADLAVVNLETAVTDGGTPAAKQYTFRTGSEAMHALGSAGVDVVSLANNHALDYGREGLRDTLRAATDAGLATIGAGMDADEAYAPFLATIRGHTVAVVGATQVMDSAFLSTWPATEARPGMASAKPAHLDRLLETVAAAREVAHTVVVFLHWGVEKHQCPSADQQALARRLVRAGADVIVGGHAHRLQGAGTLDGALVAYGLGNLVFYAESGPGADSGVLSVTVDGAGGVEHRWAPARLRSGVAHPLTGSEAAAARAAWEDLRDCTHLDP